MSLRSALVSCALLIVATPALAQTSGVAFVVDRFGNHRDGNQFTRLDAVYLSGGPGGACNGAGLADGDYFFQVTDPAGTVLLTPDPLAERRVRVTGGVFTQYLGTVRPNAAGAACGALYVRIAPLDANPLGTGEYRVWLVRTTDYDTNGAGLFGFDPALCKSDSFRITRGPQSVLRGHKFYDADGDGVRDAGEKPVGGWRVELWRDDSLAELTYTDQDGLYSFVCDRDDAEYELREVSPDGFINDGTAGATWLATTPRAGSATAHLEFVSAPEFGNVVYEPLVGAGRTPEFWIDEEDDDHGGSGHGNGGTPPQLGSDILRPTDPVWRIALNERNGMPVNLRKPVSSDDPHRSIFTLQVPPPPGQSSSGPGSSGSGSSGSGSSGSGGGSGSNQSFNGAFSNWRNYVRKDPRDHAAYLLSRQVAATLLSTKVGFMQGSIYVDRHQDGVLVSLDMMLDDVVGLLSSPGAGLTGPNDPFQDLRMHMQMCTNEFSRINETGDPNSAQVLRRRAAEPARVVAPYEGLSGAPN